jgi:hypothetical protein
MSLSNIHLLLDESDHKIHGKTMMNNEFKERLSIIRDRFNQTFDKNPLINPGIRRSAMWAVIKLGILEQQMYRSPTTENIQEFERIQNILEGVFAKVEKVPGNKPRHTGAGTGA